MHLAGISSSQPLGAGGQAARGDPPIVIPLPGLEEIVDRSSIARWIEFLLPIGDAPGNCRPALADHRTCPPDQGPPGRRRP